MNPLTDFMRQAKGLARNPLGVIALFISLIYGFACLVLSNSIDNLKSSDERLPLIWFIFIFPILILIAFVYLVAEHHEKLYAPGDYKDESNFVKTIDQKNQKQRLQNEVEYIREDLNEKDGENEKTPTKNVKEGEEDKETAFLKNIVSPIDDTQNIKMQYLIAEDLALRAFEQDRNLDIKRQSKISNSIALSFDAIALTKNNICGIEVKLTAHPYLSKILRNRLLDHIRHYSDNVKNLNLNKEFKLIIIVVTKSDINISLKRELHSLTEIANVDMPIEYLVYSLEELKKRFGVE